MKKLGLLLPVIICAFLAVISVQCKKDHDCRMRITCHISNDGIDTGEVVAKAHIVVGKEKYADYARAEGYTDNNGVFEHTFRLPALLDVKATYCTDTLWTADSSDFTIKYYAGSTQIQLDEGETVDKIILMGETASH